MRGLDAFGARDAPTPTSSEPPLSRAGAGPVFNKFIGHLAVTKTLPVDFVGTFDAFGQTAFNKPLLVSGAVRHCRREDAVRIRPRHFGR